MNTDDIVNKFANTLQNRNAKPSILYGEKKSDSSIYKQVKVRDVITIISKQLQAIKNADSIGREVRQTKTLCLKKRSDFIPPNYTPMEIQSNTENKFETQCILDTQLTNLIANAEAVMDVQNNIKENNALCQEIKNSDLEKSDVIRKCKKNADNTLTIDVKNIDDKTCKNTAICEENHINNVKNTHNYKNESLEASRDSPENRENNEYINDNADFNDSDHSITNELKIPNSPILKIVKTISKPQPLIYTLEEFDKFETLAAPVLNGTTGFEDAKWIINSQLKSTDLLPKIHSEIVTTDKEIECRLEDVSQYENNLKPQYSFDINSGVIGNNVIEDEMLFDSDDDMKYSEELPLTCSLETSFNNNTEVLDKTMYVGFQTASNQSIQILSDSFKKAKTVFENVSKTVADSLSITELVEAFDRKTSHEAEDVIKENDKDIIKNIKSTTPDVSNSGKNTIEHKNITKDGNNHITEHLDEHIMREFENNFNENQVTFESSNEIEMVCNHSSNGVDNNNKNYVETDILAKISMNKNNLKRSSNPNLIDFKTASNKKIRISDEALSKTRNIFDDIDFNNSEFNFNTDLVENSKESNNFVGFKTANNKNIKISAEGVLKAKNIFDNIDNEISSNRQKEDSKLQPIKQNKLKTEPDENGLINSMSLNHLKTLFPLKDIDLVEASCMKNSNNDTNGINHKVANNFQGFKTASNKTVIISDIMLEKSKKIFQDIEEDDFKNGRKMEGIENELYPEKSNTCLSFKGFKTANNKSIKISDEALLKTKTVFQDIENRNTFSDDKYVIQSSICMQDINTANKKTVVASQDDLGKSKILFQDIIDKDYNKNEISNQHQPFRNPPDLKSICMIQDVTLTADKFVKKPCFSGFQTANNKSVKISEKALINSRKIFEDIDLNNKDNDSYETATFKGFCTGNNKKVHVSEDALVKSGRIYENLCDKNQYCEEDLKNNIRAKLKNNIGTNVNVIKKPDIHKSKEIISYEENKITESDIHIEDFLNTEIIKIFDESLHTEDFFKETTPTCKRSGSPILSCSKYKKKKFEAPKSTNNNIQHDMKILKPFNVFKFDEHYKKTKKYKLSDILGGKSVNLIENIDPYICGFNFDTLLEFQFANNRNDIDSDHWTTDKIKKYFRDSVNKKIIPEGWIDNHIKLIIWKLISYETFFPKHMIYACCLKNVLQQLKYRYDRELYNVERPALRKILEKDDVSTKLMILCVASLYEDGVSVSSITNQIKNIELLLTDGWYCVKARADTMIEKLIIDGKISIGTKLAIHGAELTNCEQGISPWEDTSAVRLKISGNSTKRAKWDARLGFHGNGAMMSRLTAVRLEGGKISKLRVFVTRVYPTMYVEKFEDGSTVTRSERLEHLHQTKCETARQIQMEKLYEEVVKMSEQESDDSQEQYTEPGNLDTGSQISRLMRKSKDPLEFKATLTSSQTRMLNEHTDRQNEKLIQKIQSKAQVLIKKRGLDVARNVVPLMKVRVFDEKKATITIWRPNESLLDLIKEGAWIDVYNVVPTSIRYSEIQISAGRQSMFCKSPLKETDTLRTLTQTLRRKCYTIKDLQTSLTTDYNEVDTFGLVFLIEPKDFDGTKELFQNVYLSGVDKSIISVNFWGGVKKFGFENILEVGQIVVCVNLQKRAGNSRYIPQYRATEFTYFTKTPKFDSARKLLDELSAKFVKMDKNKTLQDCIDSKNNYLNLKYSNTENISPYRMNNSEYNISRNKMFIESPLIDKDVNLNLVNLESKSNFKQNRELSPNSLLRKKKVNEKIAKLEIYGEPPPLNHIHMINKSSKAIRPYKSPLISKDTSPSIANTNFKNIHNVTSNTLSVNKISSPVLNRTFVKINPVKLNFVFEETNITEQLDSPPLSLDLSK